MSRTSASTSSQTALAERQLSELEALMETPRSEFTPRVRSNPSALNSRLRSRSEESKQRATDFVYKPNNSRSPFSWFGGDDGEKKSRPPLRRTAYLDGLRGFGALLVYVLHNMGWSHSATMESSQILEHVWGYNEKYYFATFPFIRMFFTGGHLAVSIFFVISGYVLSAKPLSLIQSRDTAKLAENVGSALFRRWIRLFLPVAGLTFLWMTSWHFLNYTPSIPMAPQPTYFAEVYKWWLDFKAYSFVFSPFHFNAYSFHAWSIPMEFRGSIVIYTTLLAVAGLGTSARLRIECALMFYFMFLVDGWYCAMFVSGMFLCDIELLHTKNELPPFFAHILTQPKKFYYALLIVGIYLGGAPASSSEVAVLRKSPGWYYLSFLNPEASQNPGWFFRFWGATFIMIVIPRLAWLHSFFETRFCQYLGRISYGLYLVHGPILWSFGDRVYAAVGLVRWGHETIIPKWINCFPLPQWGIYGIEVNFLLAQMLLFPLTIYIAEIFTRLVDEPSVKLAQWLFKKHVETKGDSAV